MRSYTKRDERFWFEGGKQDAARKVPRISAMEDEKEKSQQIVIESQTLEDDTFEPKKRIPHSANELKKLKLPELVKILTEIAGKQPSLPKKPRKPDIISKICEAAILRSE